VSLHGLHSTDNTRLHLLGLNLTSTELLAFFLNVSWDQIGIGILSGSAILLSQSMKDNVRRYAPILGLASQPFWVYTSFVNNQPVLFLLSFYYVYAWGTGVKNYWYLPWKQKAAQ
jgi:hypothetical protein